MATTASAETVEYRVVLVAAASHRILTLQVNGSYQVVHISVPTRQRHVRYIQARFRDLWCVSVVLVDYLSIDDCLACVVAQLLDKMTSKEFHPVHEHQVAHEELSDVERSRLRMMLE